MKAALKQFLSTVFQLGQRIKLDILPRHFYSEIPDIRELRNTDWWRKEYSLAGLSSADIGGQLAWLKGIVDSEVAETLRATNVHDEACQSNQSDGYGRVEADVLYAFVHSCRPRRIIQIGCGVSTAVCLSANRRTDLELVCVEPYPNQFLESNAASGAVTLLAEPVQALEPSFVDGLEDGDLLFVDSSHTLGPAGEVTRIILDLLPRLSEGVYVHFHDIWFPYDFTNTILQRPQFFWHESALLQAFLTFNSDFEVLCSLSLLHYKSQGELQKVLRNYVPAVHDRGVVVEEGHYPSSIYFRRTGNKRKN